MRHLSLLLCSLLMTLIACTTGNGVPGSAVRNDTGFEYIVASYEGELSVQQGSTFKVRVNADSDLVPKIKTFVTNETLYISAASFSSKTPVRVEVTMPRLKGLTTTKDTTVVAKNIYSRQLKLDMQGRTQAVLSGEVQKLTIEAQSTVVLDATELKAQSGQVTITSAGWVNQKVNGEGRVDVYVIDELAATLAAGRLRYVVPPKRWERQVGKEAIVEKWTPGPPTQVVATETTTTGTKKAPATTKSTSKKASDKKTPEQEKKDALDKVMGY